MGRTQTPLKKKLLIESIKITVRVGEVSTRWRKEKKRESLKACEKVDLVQARHNCGQGHLALIDMKDKEKVLVSQGHFKPKKNCLKQKKHYATQPLYEGRLRFSIWSILASETFSIAKMGVWGSCGCGRNSLELTQDLSLRNIKRLSSSAKSTTIINHHHYQSSSSAC